MLRILTFSEFFSLYPDKPPVKELGQFLEFQLPRQWAPAEFPLGIQGRRESFPSVKIRWVGPTIYINTIPVIIIISQHYNLNNNNILLGVVLGGVGEPSGDRNAAFSGGQEH